MDTIKYSSSTKSKCKKTSYSHPASLHPAGSFLVGDHIHFFKCRFCPTSGPQCLEQCLTLSRYFTTRS